MMITYGLRSLLVLSTAINWTYGLLPKERFTHSSIITKRDSSFDWTTITPSPTLAWVDCSDGFQCARLEVPLDYSNPEGANAAIAILRFPSKFSVTDPRWKGPILYNPGGPGDPSTEIIRGVAPELSQIIGDEFDHVTFDPRGCGHTTPVINVFPTSAERQIWEITAPGVVNHTSDALGSWLSRAQILGTLTEQRVGTAALHSTTTTVSRDMLQITKAFGRDKLLYYGLSYGSALGLTYAALFPTNVERIVVDGVWDLDDYTQGRWFDNLADTDKAYNLILSGCAASSNCALHNSNPQQIASRIDAIFAKLTTSPVPVVINGSNYGQVDWSLARNALFDALSSPYSSFADLASAFVDLEKGNGASLFELSGTTNSLFRCTCPDDPAIPSSFDDVEAAIACGDADVIDGDLQALETFFKDLNDLSSFADVWTPQHVRCSHWPLRPKDRFTGPFTGNTSFPILLIGNIADPNLPIRNAHKMSLAFPGSVVLTQNSIGHTSQSATSTCTLGAVAAYFQNGTLPANGTVCEVEDQLFPPPGSPNPPSLGARSVGVDDIPADKLSAMRRLRQRLPIPHLRGRRHRSLRG